MRFAARDECGYSAPPRLGDGVRRRRRLNHSTHAPQRSVRSSRGDRCRDRRSRFVVDATSVPVAAMWRWDRNNGGSIVCLHPLTLRRSTNGNVYGRDERYMARLGLAQRHP